MRYHIIPTGLNFDAYLSVANPIASSECGFVRISIISCSLEDSLRRDPLFFEGDWFTTPQKLFGCAHGKFFSRLLLTTDRVGVGIGDIVKPQIRISNQEIDVPVISCAIRIIGNNAESSRAVFDSSISDNEFVVTTLPPDKFELAGVDFQSLENVKLFSTFQSLTLTFHCEENLAVVSLSVCRDKYKLMAGDATIIPRVVRMCESDI
jgi:hypothetical protein